tara:strand:- start:344 stop:445 length:102 start_codon:yes stop_codon:yes gene_type:complete
MIELIPSGTGLAIALLAILSSVVYLQGGDDDDE